MILFKKQLYKNLNKVKSVTKIKRCTHKIQKAILSLVGKFTNSAEDTCITEVITHEREMEGLAGYVAECCPHRNFFTVR